MAAAVASSGEEFELETELVVLNYLSLVPTPTSSRSGLSQSGGGLNRSTSSRSGQRTTLTSEQLRDLRPMSKNAVIQRYRESLSDQERSDTVFIRSLSDGNHVSRENDFPGTFLNNSEEEITIPVTQTRSDGDQEVTVKAAGGVAPSSQGGFRPAWGSLTSNVGKRTDKKSHPNGSTPELPRTPGTISRVPFHARHEILDVSLEAQGGGDDTPSKRPDSLAGLGNHIAALKRLSSRATPERGISDVAESLSPILSDGTPSGKPMYPRQISDMSGTEPGSELLEQSTESSPSRSVHIDLRKALPSQVEELVNNQALPASCIALKEELDQEFTKVESRQRPKVPKLSLKETSMSDLSSLAGRSTPMTPETLVAEHLGRIGDKIQMQYGNRIDLALRELMDRQGNYSYEDFQRVTNQLVQNTEGVTKVSLALLFVRQVVMTTVAISRNNFHNLVSWATRFITEQTSDYIQQRGGWAALVELDDSSLDISPSVTTAQDTDVNVTNSDSGRLTEATTDTQQTRIPRLKLIGPNDSQETESSYVSAELTPTHSEGKEGHVSQGQVQGVEGHVSKGQGEGVEGRVSQGQGDEHCQNTDGPEGNEITVDGNSEQGMRAEVDLLRQQSDMFDHGVEEEWYERLRSLGLMVAAAAAGAVLALYVIRRWRAQ